MKNPCTVALQRMNSVLKSQTKQEKEGKPQILIKLCAVEGINGIYSNDVYPSQEHQSTLTTFLTTAMRNITDDNNSSIYKIKSKFIFLQETFYDANTVHNYILFLYQNTTNILKNKWYIAKHNKDHQTIELLYFNIDRISSRYYLPPSTQWQFYDPIANTETQINTFDPEAINLDDLLFVSIDPIPDRWDDKWNVYLRHNAFDREFKEQHFDNICDPNIKDKAIEDVQWFSNAHSWYKHLSIEGEEYRIYPDYNAMTRGYSPGTRYERQIRWWMTQTGELRLCRLAFKAKILDIVNRYGTIHFNRAFCGIKRCLVHGTSHYGMERYPKSKIYEDNTQFTKEESEQQIENAVRCAFRVHDEIMKVFDQNKRDLCSHWMRTNGVQFITKGIQNMIASYIFLEYERYAFEQPVYQWNRYKTNRYFRRLYPEHRELIDAMFDKHVIDGVHLLSNKSLDFEVEGLVQMEQEIFDEIHRLYDGLDFAEFIEYQIKHKYHYSDGKRVEEIENKAALRKLMNVSFFDFHANGDNDGFYQQFDVSDEKIIDLCKTIHQSTMEF
eukprot:1155064_1